jgi:ribose 1,5-bisphosphokinase
MTGRLIAFVGASGAGKDTLMQAVARARPGLHLVRRAITRPAEAGGEPFEPVAEAEFARRQAAGGFALAWPAHGLRYGIPADVADRLAGGTDCLVNLSRAVLAEARARFPTLLVLNITAAPATLAARLAARGRESDAEIAGRLARAAPGATLAVPSVEIANDGTLDAAVAAVLAALQPVRP